MNFCINITSMDKLEKNKHKIISKITEHTSMVVSNYISHNKVPAEDLPDLIRSVSVAIQDIQRAHQDKDPAQQTAPLIPAVDIAASITPDYLVCLEDGKKLKLLKRYLRTYYDLSPDEYRRKWGLPEDYPMVAPSYAEKRSHLAKQFRLGRK